MASGREIKTKIKSVQNTRKVTRALEMVSASKIRKAQELMRASRPYARMMRQVIGHIAHANVEYKHPFLVARDEVRRVGYVVVSTDRGLCGGLNSNLFRKLLGEIRGWQDKGVEVDLVCIGQKATQFFRRLKVNMVGSVTHLGEKPQVAQLIGVIKVMLDAYTDGRIDRLNIAYNDFVNTMTQRAVAEALLPLPPSDEPVAAHGWDYLYEPSPDVVLEHVLTRYMESLVYNKARQAAITQEISEIVGGAAAV